MTHAATNPASQDGERWHRVSLRARIAGAVAIAVAAVVLALAGIVYASVRSHLRGEIDHALSDRVQVFLQPHPAFGAPPARGGGRFFPGGGPPFGGGEPPPAPDFGGAAGYFQFVAANGFARGAGGGDARLPVSEEDRQIARSGRGHAFRDVTVNGVHLRVLTVADPFDRTAVMVARPLTETDRVLDDLVTTFIWVSVAGLALAVLLGTLIARGALRPIARFVRRTESVTGALDGSERLEETGAQELARLATSFNRTLDALERSVEAQRHLVADASHELRTPISALRSNIQIFLDAHRLPVSEQAALRDSIIAELDELTQLVADVVELARGPEHREEIQRLRLDGVIQEAVDRTRRRAPGLRFTVDLEPTEIEHAPDRVGRAVTNVLDNARKWSPSGGEVDVTLAGGTLTVRDHGPGFDAADLPHVFDRFYRAERARRMPGSGLGLAIVRQAAEAGGGRAEAANAPDGGAVVRVSFGPVVGPVREAAPLLQTP